MLLGAGASGASAGGASLYNGTRSLKFDAVDEQLPLGTLLNGFTYTTKFAFGGWFKLDDLSTYNYIFGDKSLSARGIYAYVHPTGNVACTVAHSTTGGKDAFTANGAITAGVWNHIAFYYDGSMSNPVYIYVNGVMVTTGGANTSVANDYDNMVLSVMSRWDEYYTAGNVRDVFFKEGELTAGNVSTIYNGGVVHDLALTGLVDHYWECGANGDAGDSLIQDAVSTLDAVPINMEAGDLVADTP